MPDSRYPLLDWSEIEQDEKALLLTLLDELRELRREVDALKQMVHEIPVDR